MEKYMLKRITLLFITFFCIIFIFVLLGGFSTLGISFLVIVAVLAVIFKLRGGTFEEVEKKSKINLYEEHPPNNFSQHENPRKVDKVMDYK